MKIETNEQIINIASHKFIETPDRYYINMTAYDKNLCNIKGDNLGVKINNQAQMGNSQWISNCYVSYNGPQARNMIGANSYQLIRDEGLSQSGVKNGVVRDSTYPNIYHIICGTDKQKQLISVDEYTDDVKLNELYRRITEYSEYNRLSPLRIEVLCQTEKYIYVLCNIINHSGSSINLYSYQISRVVKCADVNSVKVLYDKIICSENDTASTGWPAHHNEDKASKIYEDDNICLVLSSTVYNRVVLNIIHKDSDIVKKKIIKNESAGNYNPLFISESFIVDNILHVYASTNNKELSLVKIDLLNINLIDSENIFSIEPCDIDLSFAEKVYASSNSYGNNGRSYTCHLLINDIDGKKYASIFNTNEQNSKKIDYRVINYKISDDYRTFTLIDSEINDRGKMQKHIHKLDDNKVMVFGDYGVHFYAFNKLHKKYKEYDFVGFTDVHFVTITGDNRIFTQDKFNDLKEIVPRSATNVELKFNKNRYLSTETDGTLNIKITNEFGEFANEYILDLRLIGCTFDDGELVKNIEVANGNIDIPVKITDTKTISSNAYNVRRKNNL